MAYNHGREERKWTLWKEAEEKLMRKLGIEENVIEQIRIDDRAEFNSNRRFYSWSQEAGTYLDEVAESIQSINVNTVQDLLNDLGNENLYRTMLTVDELTLQIVLMKMQGYTTKEIAMTVHLTPKAIYKRIHRLRKKLNKFKD